MTTRRKHLLYYVLSVKIYLPKEESCPQLFLNAILSGDKQVLPAKRIKPIDAPKFKELSVQKVLEAIKSDTEVMKYIPDEKMSKKTPDRDFIFDVVNTIRNDYLQA
jgi:hypothetical protein